MEREYVGIDLHRRRSVVVRVDRDGKHLSTVMVDNDPVEVMAAVAAAGANPEVVVEATFGWYWAADVLDVDPAAGALGVDTPVRGPELA